MVQEARLSAAQGELAKAQGELDEKERELAVVREKFDNAMKEKQVCKALYGEIWFKMLKKEAEVY